MLLPVMIIDGFLGSERAARLLEFACRNQARFGASGVHEGEGAAAQGMMRQSLSLSCGYDAALADFHAAIDAQFDHLREGLGVPAFVESEREIDFVAHLDGHHYRRHVDTLSETAREGTATDRMVSMVYYFHREPQAFTGGELEMFAIAGGEKRRIAPAHDRLVAFPSIAPHAVRPIALPGNRFEDARFSLACWLCRARR